MVIGWYRIIGWDYWISYLDGFFHPNSDVARGPQGHSSQGRFFFFYVILSKMVIIVKKVISGPDVLKNYDILSDLII